MIKAMTSLERTIAAISHQEPDRVPLFLLLSLYGAKELQVPIKEYFSKAENIVCAQLRMREKYNNDCIYTFSYAPIEVEAFGGEVKFVEDGPPNSGEPFLRNIKDIDNMSVPDVAGSKCLGKVLEATKLLKEKVGNETPIIGVVMSPYSLPVMQLGFEKYLDLLYFRPDYFEKLMRINEEFCVSWANAQLAAGATAICYFDPLASPNIIERQRYLTTGHEVAKRTLPRINGPVAVHLASGISFPVVDDIVATGAGIIGFSERDDLVQMKEVTKGRICLLGNLNGVEMAHWDSDKVEREIINIIEKAGSGGGLIISDNHGEVPFQVPEKVLLEISEAVRKFGVYPIKGSLKNE